MTNKTPVSSVRGAGYPQAAFAMERLLDLVAREMKLDRAEVRRRNLIPASKMPYKKPLKARSGVAMEYDSGDYPACQAEVLKAAGWDDFPKRQAEARARGPLSRHRPRAWRQGHRPRAVRVRAWCGFRAPARSRCSPAPPPWARASAPRWRRSPRAQLGVERRQDQGGGRRHRGRLARARRLRQPADRHRRLVGASGGQGGGRQGEEGRVATCWKPPSTISNWSDGEVRVVGAPQLNVKLAEIARILQGAPGYGFPPGVDPGLEANVDAPHRRAVLRQRLPRRRGRGRRRDRRGENPALRRDAGLRRADQSDDGRGPDPRRRRARHRQRVLRMDGLRRRRAAGDHDVRGLSAADRDRSADADDALQGDALAAQSARRQGRRRGRHHSGRGRAHLGGRGRAAAVQRAHRPGAAHADEDRRDDPGGQA